MSTSSPGRGDHRSASVLRVVPASFRRVAERPDVTTSEASSYVVWARYYAEAGADCAFVTGRHSLKDVERIGRETEAPHRMFVVGGSSELERLSLVEIRQLGFDIFTPGLNLVRVAALAMLTYLDELAVEGPAVDARFALRARDTAVGDWNTFTGFGAVLV